MKKLTALLLSLTLLLTLLSILPVGAMAAQTETVSGVTMVLEADKEEYTAEEQVKLSLTIENTNAQALEGLTVDTKVPAELTFISGGMQLSGALLEAGKSLETAGAYGLKSHWDLSEMPEVSPEAGTIPEPEVDFEDAPADTTPGSTSPEAEDEGMNPLLIAVIVLGGVILILAIVLVVVRRKKAAKALCLLLCCALVLPLLPLNASAEAEPSVTLSQSFTIDGTSYTIEVYVSFQVAQAVQEKDTADIIQQAFGVAPDENDADGDTLTNLVEITLTGTDPLVADTDGDGLTDAQEDRDGDGLANGEELLRGTDPSDADTDHDGISDHKELMELGTDPCKADSDADGLSDSDELVLELNPTQSMSDGTTPDGQRTFTRDLSADRIDERLSSEDNAAQPFLTLTTTGNIDSRVSVAPVDSYVFTDSRALVGEVIEIKGSDLGEGTVTFTFTEAVTPSEGDFDPNLVCKYNEDGTTEYLDTTYDPQTHSISAPVAGEGTYFVMDVAALFAELGLEMPGVTTSHTRKLASAAVPADIVFIIDTTSSMGDEIDHVQENLSAFMDALKSKGVSAQLALVSYQDFTTDGAASTRVHQNGGANWFADIDAYGSALSGLTLGDGGDDPECVLDALETARLLDLRSAAGKAFILVTDAPYKTDNRYGIPDLNTQIQLLNNAGVSCSVICPPDLKSTYTSLFMDTDGFWSNIYGDFSADLVTLADSIGSQIVGDGYWIYLKGPVPVPVRLDAQPAYGSNTDTDKDGIPDYIELGGADPTGSVDLDALLTQVSKGTITGTDYGTVMTYEYQSDPSKTDTDYDGIGDLADEAPTDNHFTGVMHYDDGKNKANVSFNVDYSQMFKDNSAYYQDLAMYGIIFASDIYGGCYIDVQTGTTGGSDDPTELPQLFGLEDVEDISLYASDYEVDKDDLTEVVIGHRTVRVGSVTREIILLSVRGTNSTNAEWSSNFDVGADSAEYYNAVGSSHPDWINKDNHKGFDVATNRVLVKFYDYIDRHELENVSNKTILINGHSRGAAIANLLGAHFEDSPDYTSFTYTFATPYSTTDEKAEDYKTVFNIVNSDDLIPYLPLPEWGFANYGITKTISVNNHYEDSNAFGNATGTFEWLCGYDYNDNGGIAGALDAFSKLATCREDLYILDTSTDGIVNIGNQYHTTVAGAEKRKAALAEELEGVKLYRFVQLDVRESIGIKRVDVTYSPAYLMQNLANMASTTGPLTGYDVKGKYASAKSAFITCFINGMVHPHQQVTYYLIAYNNVEPLS